MWHWTWGGYIYIYIYIYCVFFGHQTLQETLGGADDGYAILGGLLEMTMCEEGFCWWMYALSGFGCYRRLWVEGCIPWDETIVWTHNLGSDIVVCGRAVWVRMSLVTFGCMCVYARPDYGTFAVSGFRYCRTLWETIWGGWRYVLCIHYRRQFVEDGRTRYLGTGRGITLWVTYLPTYQPINTHTCIHRYYIHTYIRLNIKIWRKHAFCWFFEILIFLDNFWLPGLLVRLSIKICLKFS